MCVFQGRNIVVGYFYTYILLKCFHHSGRHHDDADDGDQQEIEGVHEPGACGLFDLGTAVTAAGAGC